MVALVIALLLLAGLFQVLLGSRQSFNTSANLAGLHENENLVTFVLQNTVAHAGYQPAKQLIDNPNSVVKDPIIGVAGAKDPNAKSDSIRVRFQASGGVKNCIGDTVGGPEGPEPADFTLYVKNDTLYCDVSDQNPEPLANNVTQLKISYGLDTDGDDSVDTYTNDLNENEQTQVRSVHLQLLMGSDKNVLPQATKRTYVFADGDAESVNDRRAWEMLDQTIVLRNLLP